MRGNSLINHQDLLDLRLAVYNKLKSSQTTSSFEPRGNNHYYGPFADHICDCVKDMIKDGGTFGISKNEVQISDYILYKIFYAIDKKSKPAYSLRTINIQILAIYGLGELLSEEKLNNSPRALLTDYNQNEDKFLNAKIFNSISKDKFLASIRNSTKRIRIIDTYLDDWIVFRSDLKIAVENGCKLELLLCDPRGSIAKFRIDGLRSEKRAEEHCWEILKDIHAFIKRLENYQNVQIKLYDQLPGFNLYSCDRHLFIGWYWMDKAAHEGPVMEFSKSENVFQASIEEHFETLWEKAGPLDLESIEIKAKDASSFSLDNYIGKWYLYCNYGRAKNLIQELPLTATTGVAKNILEINKDKQGRLTCILNTADNYISQHTGILKTTNNSSFFICELENQLKTTKIILYVHKGQGLDDYLTGTFTNLYGKEPILGSGVIFLKKVPDEENISTCLIRHLEVSEFPAEDAIIRYLFFNINNRLEVIQDFDHVLSMPRFKDPCPFSGVYKVLSYHKGRGNDERYISEGILYISEFYECKHKRLRSFSSKIESSHGRVEILPTGQLVIYLKNDNKHRIGFFLVTTVNNEPEQNSVFTGIFNGLGYSGVNTAISNRVIMVYKEESYDYFQSEYPRHYLLNSEDYHSLPEEITQNLTGRINNFIGFIRNNPIFTLEHLRGEAEKEISMKEIFIDSTLQNLHNDYSENAAKMFLRAVQHGFCEIDEFNAKTYKMLNNNFINQRVLHAFEQHPDYLTATAQIRPK